MKSNLSFRRLALNGCDVAAPGFASYFNVAMPIAGFRMRNAVVSHQSLPTKESILSFSSCSPPSNV